MGLEETSWTWRCSILPLTMVMEDEKTQSEWKLFEKRISSIHNSGRAIMVPEDFVY